MWYRFESKKRNMTLFIFWKNYYIVILGFTYFEGRYVQKDIRKCIHYFKLASDQKYSNAQNFLGFIYSDKKYNNFDIRRAIYYNSLSANQNKK